MGCSIPKLPSPGCFWSCLSGIRHVFQRWGHVLPVARRGWLGAGEAAVFFSSNAFAVFIHIPTEFEKHTSKAFLEAASLLPTAPISLKPSSSLLIFFLLQNTVLLDS